MTRQHVFVVHVQDLPGVLDRVASLFRRRGYNIESLTVGHTETPGVSRMTIVMNGDDSVARLVKANLYKLVNVLWVDDVTHVPSVVRDMALIKVRADSGSRQNILQLCEVFRARVIDVATSALVVEITGAEDKIQGLVEVLAPFGIIEMVRTGAVAMRRGAGETQDATEPLKTTAKDAVRAA
ncbi:MAG TPA: acetolactate synthase small subunit [Kofleriaceae bacterium]|nr:acetolactate synthase small subunit [Kofleriaceae bacterium]